MGRTSDEEGETSTTTCRSDDVDDRPLKKARYVWQIKGKYHLKKSEDDKGLPFIPKTKGSKGCDRIVPTSCDEEQSLGTEKVEETPMKIEENNTKEDSSAEKESEDMPLTARAEFSRFLRNHMASTLLLRKWQARQVARCFVDNTINRVLEDMGFVPLPVDADEFPMTESENDDGLEDEAVLMAIHSHGLQRSEGEPSGSSAATGEVKDQSAGSYLCKETNSSGTSHCACSLAQRTTGTIENLDPFHQRPVCHVWDQLGLDSERYQELQNIGQELVDRGQWCSDSGLFNSFASSESSSDGGSKCYEEDYEQRTAKVDDVTIQEQSDMEEDREHSDFLDKAVAVAIQKKGLSAFSCTDYG